MPWNRASCSEYDGKSMDTEITTWSEFPTGWKTILEQILASEEINKSKKAGLWESQSGIQVGKLTICVRSFEIEKFKQSSPDLSVLREYVSQSLWWTLKFPRTNTFADGLIERTSSMLASKDKEGDQIEEKEVRHCMK